MKIYGSCNLMLLSQVQQNVAETMIDQLRLQYVSEGADDSISQAWDKMQQDVRFLKTSVSEKVEATV